MLPLILGWLLIVIGAGLDGLAVRAWFNGSVYLPSQNTAAIVVGLVLLLAGCLMLTLWGGVNWFWLLRLLGGLLLFAAGIGVAAIGIFGNFADDVVAGWPTPIVIVGAVLTLIGLAALGSLLFL